MGLISGGRHEVKTFECDSCPASGPAQHTGTSTDLNKLGWERHHEWLMCPDCAKYFTSIWKLRAALDEGASG